MPQLITYQIPLWAIIERRVSEVHKVSEVSAQANE